MHSMGRIVSQIALRWMATNLGHPVGLVLYGFVPHFHSIMTRQKQHYVQWNSVPLLSIGTSLHFICSNYFLYFINNKTGTCQCTRAVWSTFAEIHSTHWNFRLEFVTHTSQHTRDLPNLSYDCDLWIHQVFRLLLVILLITSGTLSACRSFSRSEGWLNQFSHCFNRISFCSHIYMNSQNALLTSQSTCTWAWQV